MPIVLDPGGRAAKAFDLQAMPSTAIIDRSGTVRFAHIGYTDKTIGQYRAEKPRLDLRNYFSGTVDGWGMFRDRSGKVVKRFSVVILHMARLARITAKATCAS
jgi:hypothetical protein